MWLSKGLNLRIVTASAEAVWVEVVIYFSLATLAKLFLQHDEAQ